MKNHTNTAESAVLEPHSGIRQALLDLLKGRPELVARFGHFQAAFADQNLLPERLLEICRVRIDALHRLPAVAATQLSAEDAARVSTGDFSCLSAAERAILDLAEQMTIDAHGVAGEQITALSRELGEPGAVTLLTAIALLDTNARMQRVLQTLRDARRAANA